MKKVLIPTLLASAILVLSACSGGGTASTDAPVSPPAEGETAAVESKVEQVISKAPRPAELPALLETAGADFDKTLPNSVEAYSRYNTASDKAALNLGVFGTDIGYLCAFQQVGLAYKYLKPTQELANSIGVADAYNLISKTRLEASLNNRDSLVAVLNDILANAHKMLTDNQRAIPAALIGTGAYVEGLYIATQSVARYPKNIDAKMRDQVMLPLTKTIADQQKPLDEIIAILEQHAQDNQVAGILTQLKELQAVYAKLDLDAKIKQQTTPSNVLADGALTEIITKVETIRSGIVK